MLIRQSRVCHHWAYVTVGLWVMGEVNPLIQAMVLPTGTWRNNNVIMMSKPRCDVIVTLLLRRVPTGYDLWWLIRRVFFFFTIKPARNPRYSTGTLLVGVGWLRGTSKCPWRASWLLGAVRRDHLGAWIFLMKIGGILAPLLLTE